MHNPRRSATSTITLCDSCNHTFPVYPAYPQPENEHFRSGAPPDAEISLHLAVIGEIEEDMKRYDSELDRLRKVVQELELERNMLQRRLDEHRNLASAIRRLPVEIWDTIFRQVVVSWPDHRKKPTKHSLYLHYQHSEMREECIPGEVLAPPMVLSQVSSSWRSMVHSMPHLWASISVDVYGLNMDIIPLLDIYYQRSENYPLTIQIIDSEWKAEGGFDRGLRAMIEDEYYDPEEVGLDTFMFLMKSVSRCEVLSLDLPLGRFDNEEIPQLSFPILHTFICDRTLSPKWLLPAIRQAPQLIHLHTWHIVELPTMLPVGQLKSLRVHAFTSSLSQLLAVLASSSIRLETLEIAEFGRTQNQDDSHSRASVTLASVRQFIFHIHPPYPHIGTLLSSLKMPSLSILEVRTNASYGCSANGYPWGSVNDFLDRSTPPLVNFSLSLPGMTLIEGIPSFMQVVRRLPELATFKLALEYPLGLDTPFTAFYSSLSELLVTLAVPFSNASAERVIAPKLKRFCLTVTERDEPLPRIKICQDMVSFAASRSEQGLISSGMKNAILPLEELMLEIHTSSEVLEKWPSFYSAMSDEDEVKGLWNQVRELTAGGMKCTIEQWSRGW